MFYIPLIDHNHSQELQSQVAMLRNFPGNVLAITGDDTNQHLVRRVDGYQPSQVLVLLICSKRMVQKEAPPVNFHIVP